MKLLVESHIFAINIWHLFVKKALNDFLPKRKSCEIIVAAILSKYYEGRSAGCKFET